MRAAALVQGVFVCINNGVTPRTFPRILHVDTRHFPASRTLHPAFYTTPLHLPLPVLPDSFLVMITQKREQDVVHYDLPIYKQSDTHRADKFALFHTVC